MDFRDLLRARPLVAEHLKKDFAAFCRSAWPHLHPGAKLSWTTGHYLICEHLVAVWQGQTKRLIVNCPPRYSKSTIVTIFFPVWAWLQDPTKAFLCCSYEIDLATNHNLDRRRLMDSKWFRELFADCLTLATDRSQAEGFSNTAGGTMLAASVNSKAQGRGGDIVIVDDPLSADAATSETFRNETNSWFVHQLPQRLNNPSQSAIILVMQRLHQDDPTGFLTAQEESDWTLLKLPLIAEEDETWTFPVSGRVWTRKKGECLDPKRWSAKVVRQRQQNRLVWSGQFMQEPAPTEGNLIRVDEILYYGGRDPETGALDPALPESFERKIISVDATFKSLASSDFVVVIVVGIVGSRRYLLHVTNAHLDLTGTENEIRNCRAQFGPISATLVEDKANGPAVISHLRDEIPGIVAIDPQGGKMARVVAASPEFQARNWIVERNGPWTHRVVEQLTMFPNAKNDDITDAVTQASVWLQSNTYELGLLDLLKRQATEIASGIRNKYGELIRKPEPKFVAVTRLGTQADVKETAIPSSCAHCGSYKLESCGSGQSTRLHCLTCGRYSWGELFRFPCPKCGDRLTGLVGGGKWRCNACGHHFTPGVAEPETEQLGCEPGCSGFVRQVVSGRIRCGNCGRYHTASPVVAGMTREQYNNRRKKFWN